MFRVKLLPFCFPSLFTCALFSLYLSCGAISFGLLPCSFCLAKQGKAKQRSPSAPPERAAQGAATPYHPQRGCYAGAGVRQKEGKKQPGSFLLCRFCFAALFSALLLAYARSRAGCKAKVSCFAVEQRQPFLFTLAPPCLTKQEVKAKKIKGTRQKAALFLPFRDANPCSALHLCFALPTK